MTGRTDRHWSSRLSARFAVVVALALLPVGVVAVLQTRAVEAEVRARAGSALLGATLRAAEAETSVIRHAQGLVAGIAAAIPLVADDPSACSMLLKRGQADEPMASVLTFVPQNGHMSCSTAGVDFDFSQHPLSREIGARREPSLFVNADGPLSGKSILGLSHPVFDPSGAYLGYASLSLPHDALLQLQLTPSTSDLQDGPPIVFWSFNGDGEILTSSIDRTEADRLLPQDVRLTDLGGTKGQVFDGVGHDGTSLTYAVVPIIERELYLMSSWQREAMPGSAGLRVAPYLPVLLMWVVGFFVSAIAAERLVTRHVRKLNNAIISFAQGDRRLQSIETDGAPVEIQELAGAYDGMTESIMRGEADLEHNLHQREVLLREVHHRVKNNLQLISSVMNIQHRSAVGSEAKSLIKSLQERIMSLATVHRELYQTSGLVDVKARELIPDIVRQIMALSTGPERPFNTTLDIDDLHLVPDQAVSLSLLLTEAMANAIKHAGSGPGRPAELHVRLKRCGGSEVVLEVGNSLPAIPAPADHSQPPDSGIGNQLLSAFIDQLGGTIERRIDNGQYELRATFSIAPPSFGENRQFEPPDKPNPWN